MDEATKEWGIKVERVEVRDVRLQVAEVSRQAKSKVIEDQKENHASKAMKDASDVISSPPAKKRKKTKEEETSDVVFGATGPAGLALRNPIVLEKIVGFLNAGDLCRWYESSKIFKEKFDKMDDIFWKREAQTLAAVLRENNEDCLEEQWPGKTYHDIFIILKSDVERLVVKIKAMLSLTPIHLRASHIADAARLAHQGFLCSVRRLSLRHPDFSCIPVDHMASLVACVKDEIQIEYEDYSDLLVLDNVHCECLSIASSSDETHWETEEIGQTLVRAMRTRVKKLCVGLTNLDAVFDMELMKYDGEGKCEQVNFIGMDFLTNQERQYIELWLKDLEWQVLADEGDVLFVKRKES